MEVAAEDLQELGQAGGVVAPEGGEETKGDETEPGELEAFATSLTGKKIYDLEVLHAEKIKKLVKLREEAFLNGEWDLEKNSGCQSCEKQLSDIREELRDRGDFQLADIFAERWLNEKHIQMLRSLARTEEALIMGDMSMTQDVTDLKGRVERVQQNIAILHERINKAAVKEKEKNLSEFEKAEGKMGSRMNYMLMSQSFMMGALVGTVMLAKELECGFSSNYLVYFMIIIVPLLGSALSGMSVIILFPQFEILVATHSGYEFVGPEDVSGKKWTLLVYRVVILLFALAWLLMLLGGIWFLEDFVTSCD